MPGDREYWVALNHVRGIGAARLRKLREAFGSLREAWQAPRAALIAAGLDERTAESLCEQRKRLEPQALLERIEGQGIRVLLSEDERYPSRLREIDYPPPVLFTKGELAPADEWAVAIVGTRRPTAYGRQAAEQFASALAGAGITIVSGLARGIDAQAHEAALEAGGRTVAVLGNGVDIVYPAEHKRLAARMVERGAIISDYPPGTPPDAANFPPRNRIISGMSLATLVIEAGETSGALLTAHYAAEQGRDVFALPGNIFSPSSRGTNRLIQDGAAPALEPKDVLSAMGLDRVPEQRQARMLLPETPTEAQLLAVLNDEPLHVDEIRARVNLAIEEVTGALVLMELKGMVRQVGGMQYVIVR